MADCDIQSDMVFIILAKVILSPTDPRHRESFLISRRCRMGPAFEVEKRNAGCIDDIWFITDREAVKVSIHFPVLSSFYCFPAGFFERLEIIFPKESGILIDAFFCPDGPSRIDSIVKIGFAINETDFPFVYRIDAFPYSKEEILKKGFFSFLG